MQFLLNLLRIKGLYMFRVLIIHPQEELRNATWYIACMLSQLAAPIQVPFFVAPPEVEQVMLETCRGP
jgi:hypothetical protein